MTPEEIERLAHLARRARVAGLDLQGPDLTLRLRLDLAVAPSGAPATPVVVPALESQGPRSPGVGLFRHLHPLNGRPISEAGQQVEAGQIVGYLDVGTSLRPVTAPTAGIIGAPLLDDGVLVGYGTPLYTIR